MEVAKIQQNVESAMPGLTVGVFCWSGAIRSPMDKRSCVVLALKECPEKTLKQIADQVGCHTSFVGKIQNELSTSRKLDVPVTRTGKDGKSYPTSYKKAAPATKDAVRRVRTFARMPHDVWKVKPYWAGSKRPAAGNVATFRCLLARTMGLSDSSGCSSVCSSSAGGGVGFWTGIRRSLPSAPTRLTGSQLAESAS